MVPAICDTIFCLVVLLRCPFSSARLAHPLSIVVCSWHLFQVYVCFTSRMLGDIHELGLDFFDLLHSSVNSWDAILGQWSPDMCGGVSIIFLKWGHSNWTMVLFFVQNLGHSKYGLAEIFFILSKTVYMLFDSVVGNLWFYIIPQMIRRR